MARTITDTEIENRRAAQIQHGQRSDFAETQDPQALTEPQRSRLAELREQLANADGRVDALADKAASLGLIVEWGQAWLREKAEREGPGRAFESPMLTRWFTAFEAFRRAIESLHRITAKGGGGGPDAGDVLDAIRGKREQDGE